jgi:outer membrane protein OmpA-like peptidoglycan-associated protein
MTARRRTLRAWSVIAAAALSCSCTTQKPKVAADAPAAVPLTYRLQQQLVGNRPVFVACTSDCAEPTPKTLPQARAVAQAIRASEPATVTALVQPPKSETATVLFDFGSAAIRPQAQRELRTLKHLFSRASSVRITAYTDNRGPEGANTRLADARALAVMQLIRDLIADVATKPKLTATGRPLCCYVAANTSDPPRGLNRRAEIVIEAAPGPTGNSHASNNTAATATQQP